MHSPNASRRGHDDEDHAGALRRIRRRGGAGAVFGCAGFVATFITDVVHNMPRDDQIITGLEIGFGLIALAGYLAVFVLWVLAESTDYAQRIWGLRDRSEHMQQATVAGARRSDAVS